MIQKFIEDTLGCITQIEQAIEHHDIHEIRKTAHGLKGIARNVEAEPLAQVAFELEQARDEGKEQLFAQYRDVI